MWQRPGKVNHLMCPPLKNKPETTHPCVWTTDPNPFTETSRRGRPVFGGVKRTNQQA